MARGAGTGADIAVAQETDKMENSSDGFASKGYRWDAEDTSLQIILMTGDKIKPSGTIVVGVK